MYRTVFTALFLLLTTGAGALDVGADIIDPAKELIGVPYQHQGTSRDGFDCSGFIYYLYKPYLYSLPRTSFSMHRASTHISLKEAIPGDLVFFETMGTGAGISHVGLYIGDGTVIHSVSNGPETGVIVSSIKSGYWRRTLHSVGRVIEAKAEIVSSLAIPPTEPAEAAQGWSTFDGFVYGDYESWKRQDEEAFEEFKRKEREGY